jgi:hypothetical protein
MLHSVFPSSPFWEVSQLLNLVADSSGLSLTLHPNILSRSLLSLPATVSLPLASRAQQQHGHETPESSLVGLQHQQSATSYLLAAHGIWSEFRLYLVCSEVVELPTSRTCTVYGSSSSGITCRSNRSVCEHISAPSTMHNLLSYANCILYFTLH